MSGLKVFFISTAFPLPRNCGKAQVLSGICDFLTSSDKVDQLTYIHISSKANSDAGLLPITYLHLERPSIYEAVGSLVTRLLCGRLPCLQEVLTYSRRTRRKIVELIKDQQPDIIICDTIRTAQYFGKEKPSAGKYYLYLDDLFSVRYERILETLKNFDLTAVNPLGNFSSFVPRAIRFLGERKFAVRFLLGYEMIAVRSQEKRMTSLFERCFLISPSEVNILKSRASASNVFALRLLSGQMQSKEVPPEPDKYFAFVGDLKLAHNYISIYSFVAEAAVLLKQQLPDYQLRIAGKGSDPKLAQLCDAHDNVTLLGFVDDLDVFLAKSTGMIAPLLFGSGIKIKCLDALRLGTPIVATDFGVEGLGLTPGIEYLHAESAADTVKSMAALADKKTRERVSLSGRRWLQQNYAPDVVAKDYDRLLLS